MIELPVSRPTCPAFGGKNYKTLYITSAREKLAEDELSIQPDAGKTFVIDVDVPGVPEFRVKLFEP